MSDTSVQAESTRDRIVRTAIGLFHARSYSAVGVAEICEAAEVNKGSFYHHFESKEAVVLAAIDVFWAQGEPWFRSILIDDSDTPPLERFDNFFKGMHRKISCSIDELGYFPGCPVGNLVAELSTQNEAVRLKLAQTYENWAAVFEVPLREARQSGELSPGTDVKAMARAIVTVMQGLSLITKAYNDPRKVQKIGRTLIQRVLGLDA